MREHVSGGSDDESSPRLLLGKLWGMFFLLGMSSGFYVPALTNVLLARGMSTDWVQWVWLSGPVTALLAPVTAGALADHRYHAEKVFGVLSAVSGVLLFGAFVALQVGAAGLFLALMFASAFAAAPMWSLLASISMAHLRSGEKEFPLVRLGGTLGWMAAGAATSWVLRSDLSPISGMAGGLTRIVAGVAAFWLPFTPPLAGNKSLRALLGLRAYALLRERDHLVFFTTTALLSVPLAAFYMWTPIHLEQAGDTHVTATMAIGQFSEILGMLGVVALLGRFRVKTLLLFALMLSAARYGLFSWAGFTGARGWLWAGVSMHGLCYTLYFITAQLFLDRRVELELRSQAQGMLAMFSGGLGTLLGTVLVRWLYDRVVAGQMGGWTVYWGLLGGSIALLAVFFAFAYRGVEAQPK